MNETPVVRTEGPTKAYGRRPAPTLSTEDRPGAARGPVCGPAQAQALLQLLFVKLPADGEQLTLQPGTHLSAAAFAPDIGA